MKTKSLYLIPILIISYVLLSFDPNSVNHVFKHSKFSSHYSKVKGKIHGPYASFYPNGQMKSEGQFENNYRTGIWSLWNEKGEKIIVRDYKTPFEYYTLFPVDGFQPESLNKPVKNKEGFIEFYSLHENDVEWLQRTWRIIDAENNPVLFETDLLAGTMIRYISTMDITPYDASSDDFKETLKAIPYFDYPVVQFKIKEEVFLDNKRKVLERRIIGICPVIEVDGKFLDQYWIYYPEARSSFAKVNVPNANFPEYVETLDDYFYYRCFGSTIIKESNIHDVYISDYASGIEAEKKAEEIELNIIEREHDTWLKWASQSSEK